MKIYSVLVNYMTIIPPSTKMSKVSKVMHIAQRELPLLCCYDIELCICHIGFNEGFRLSSLCVAVRQRWPSPKCVTRFACFVRTVFLTLPSRAVKSVNPARIAHPVNSESVVCPPYHTT